MLMSAQDAAQAVVTLKPPPPMPKENVLQHTCAPGQLVAVQLRLIEPP
jgi:hypothetical protein